MIKSPWLVILGLVVAIPSTALPETLFDDFNDGDATDGDPLNWIPGAGGEFSASTGDLFLTAGPFFGTAYAEGHVFSDVSVQTQGRVLGVGSILVMARFEPAVGGYLGTLNTDGVLRIQRIDGTTLGSATLDIDSSADVVIQLDVVGNKLSLRAWRPGEPIPEEPQVTAVDDTRKSGFVGLAVNNPKQTAVFRYFQACEILPPEIPVPLFSSWGLFVMPVVLLSLGALVLIRRSRSRLSPPLFEGTNT